MSNIQVGSSLSGRTFITGNSSNFDSLALIDKLVSVRNIRIKRDEERISADNRKVQEFRLLQSAASRLQSAFDRLKFDILGNVFDGKQPSYASANPALNPNSFFTASANNFALSGSTTVEVMQLARAFAAAGTAQTSATSALNLDGTFDIALDGKTAASIAVAPGDTLQDIRNRINAQTSASGVSADIIQTAPGEFRLVIRGADPAKNVTVSNIGGADNVLEALGVTDAGGNFLDIVQPPQQAWVKINGIDTYADSNAMQNVLTGVNLNLTNAAPGNPFTLTIGNNVDGVKNALKEMVAAYNEMMDLIDRNQRVDGAGNVDPDAVLYGENLVKSLARQTSQMIGEVYGDSNMFNGLRSVGISVDAGNRLVINEGILTNALTSNFEDVRKVFATNGSVVGMADAVSEMLNGFTNLSTGAISRQITTIQENNLRTGERVSNAKERLKEYQDQLIEKFSKMEAAIKRGELMRKSILAILEGQKKGD